MWIRDWDEMAFDSEEEAFGDACMEMLTDGATEDYLKPWVSYNQLVAWAMKQDGFFEVFEDELYKAQRDYFNDFYFEIEDDEDENC
jgi:hypothetical protein